jgi:S-adenosylmethionine:tRNA ribosyltransferase-isomerase
MFPNTPVSLFDPVDVLVSDFDYHLPEELIAQAPEAQRDGSRLLIFDRAAGLRTHARFRDLLSRLHAGDVLVLNDSKVIPARLFGFKAGSEGRVEVLLLEQVNDHDWWTMMRPGKRVRPGTKLHFKSASFAGLEEVLTAEALEKNSEGHVLVRFSGVADFEKTLFEIGEIPLPPYIAREGGRTTAEDRNRYQTVYGRENGSVAAPTAGLHFSKELLSELEARGVELRYVTLHVGAGTFLPVKAEKIADHIMHEERFEVSQATADAINGAKAAGRRVIAVGTTTTRVLESVARDHDGVVKAGRGRTRIFIHPPYRFRVVDALITNFHLPQSTLLMLVSAFASPGTSEGIRTMLDTYAEAVRERYRFFSYGDAMFIH